MKRIVGVIELQKGFFFNELLRYKSYKIATAENQSKGAADFRVNGYIHLGPIL
jgi:hypothetical protein